METVIGADPIPVRQEDVDAAARREVVQGCFKEHDPKMTQKLMLVHDVSAKELHDALDYKLDATAWMRENGFPDGFQGLKVWPKSEVDKFYAWHDKVSSQNALNLPGIRPSYSQVQAIMDREFGAHAISPAHPIPWH
jgi:hypothetical protein